MAGIWGNVRYISPLVAYKSFRSMHYLMPTANRAQRARLCARSSAMCRALAATWRRRNNRFYSGGEAELRGFDVRGATPYGYVPTRTTVQLTNPDGTCVPRDPEQSAVEPVHPGADSGLRHRIDRRRHQPDSPTRSTAFRSSVR